MLLHSSLERSEDWPQQHCFIHEPCQDSHVALEHIVHQCLIFIRNCLAFGGIIIIFVECMTATEIHC